MDYENFYNGDLSDKRLKYYIVNKIAKKVIGLYKGLPTKGKPIVGEFTVLSSIVKITKSRDGEHGRLKHHIEVISVGTGVGFVNKGSMCTEGETLNDIHAEVMARRGFLIYLYENIDNALEGKESIFTVEDDILCKLKSCFSFAFYSSRVPCGDASIITRDPYQESDGEVSDYEESDDEDLSNEPIHGTNECNKDLKCAGRVHTKQASGTGSVSCSDKIARWVHLGLQGSLLSMLLSEPICISHIIFGNDAPFCKRTLWRALLYRNCTNVNLTCKPWLYNVATPFNHAQDAKARTRPAPGSIVWVGLQEKNLHQVAISRGYAQGPTKSQRAELVKCTMQVSKARLFDKFMTILRNNPVLKMKIIHAMECDEVKYDMVKGKSTKYYVKWLRVKKEFFKGWNSKPNIWKFTSEEPVEEKKRKKPKGIKGTRKKQKKC